MTRRQPLRLESGVLAETNGIRLMEAYDIDASIRADAKRGFDRFSGYVMQPHFLELD